MQRHDAPPTGSAAGTDTPAGEGAGSGGERGREKEREGEISMILFIYFQGFELLLLSMPRK